MKLDFRLQKYKNEDDRRIASILLKMMGVMLLAFAIIIVTAVCWEDPFTIRILLIAGLALLAPLWMLLAGFLQAGGLGMVVIALILITVAAMAGQGIHDISMLGFPVVVMAASLSLHRRLYFIACFMVLLATAWLVFGENYGLFVTVANDMPGLLDYVTIATILLVGVMAVDMLAENMRESMNKARNEIGRRQVIESQLRHQSTHDGLTGIYNRFVFEQELTRLETSQNFPVSMIVADVDGLKMVNDTQGHARGDQLLIEAAAALRAIFRVDDVLARIGGDEFAILLPRTDAETVQNLLSRVRARLDEQNAAHPDLPIHLSLGSATAAQGSLEETFKRADRDMYVDKAIRKKQQ